MKRLLLLTVLLVPAPAPGQVPTLGRVDSLVTVGEYEQARDVLDRWWSARNEFEVPGSDMARALMLRGRLAPDPGTAEPDYLAVVLGYPTSDYAPEALLRLGQGLLATGDATRAAGYLERLVADYPGRSQRLTGLLWLARANMAAGRPGAACAAAREGLRDVRNPDVRAMLQVEAGAACSVRTEPEPEPEREPEREPEPAPVQDQPVATTGPFAAQTGAFRYRESADALLERLGEAGYTPRLVLVPGSDLLRVRVGRFQTSEEARALVGRLQSQGFEAVLVRNADDEQEP